MIGLSIILGLVGLFTSLVTSGLNQSAQRKANQQAMDFNAEESDKSRQWQEEQYKKYESVAAQMQQRQQAGLNPYENLTSMSVGSGSTASTSANQISPLSVPDMSTFSQLPGIATQVKQTQLQNKLLQEQTQGAKLDNEAKAMNNIKLAIETNDYASYYALIKDGLVKGNKLTDEQIKKAFEEARLAHVQANNAEEAASAGVNPLIDAHNVSVATVSKVANDIAISKSVDADRHKLAQVEYLIKQNEYDQALAITNNVVRDYDISTTFGVDYATLPPYLQQESQLLYFAFIHNSDDAEYLTELTTAFYQDLENYTKHIANSLNPDYITTYQSADLNLRKAQAISNASNSLTSFMNIFKRGKKGKK